MRVYVYVLCVYVDTYLYIFMHEKCFTSLNVQHQKVKIFESNSLKN